MKKRIFSMLLTLCLILVLLPIGTSAVEKPTIKFERKESPVEYLPGKYTSGEYMVITAVDSNGKILWERTTNHYALTELEAVCEIGIYQNNYLYSEKGTITAVNLYTGELQWKNSDFGGNGIYSFIDENGDIYACGYYGPDFYAIDKNGKTLSRIESFDPEYYWPTKIQKISSQLFSVYLENGPYERDYTFYVNLADYSYSRNIKDLIVGSFQDVVKKSWCADSVQWAVNQGITTGTNLTAFSPSRPCTNAQILTFLWRANHSPEPHIANPFVDVKTGAYYEKAVRWAFENGLISDTECRPDEPCTRAMIVTALWKLSGCPKVEDTTQFTDVPVNASYRQAVAWALENGITAGKSQTEFAPEDSCTRGQIVTFLYRYANL